MIETVLSAIALIEGPEMSKLRALLLGYQAEAIRDEARLRIADILAQEPPAQALPDDAGDDLEFLLADALAQEFRTAA
jgi:hypothetical protein